MRKSTQKSLLTTLGIVILLFLVIRFYQTKYFNNSESINKNCLDLAKSFMSTDEQRLIDTDVILTTIRFMLDERKEDDSELVDFVRKLVVQPSSSSSLSKDTKKKSNNDFSQNGQSEFIDEALGSMRDGFFVEAGAYDGQFLSNSLFFELERSWTGILIEPIPSLFKKLRSKNRKAYALNACIASNKRPIVAKYRLGDALSGRIAKMSETHLARIDNSTGNSLERIIYVPCFALSTILKAIGVRRVDYFSLDVEGGEIDVLTSIDFNRLDIRTFTIEHNGEEKRKAQILEFMISKGYKLLKQDDLDFYFLKQ